MAPSTRPTQRPRIGVTRVRQARLGRQVLWMLIAALLLVVLGFLATWTWHARDFARVRGGAAPAAQTFTAPQPNSAVRQNYQNGAPLAPRNGGNPGQPDRSATGEP